MSNPTGPNDALYDKDFAPGTKVLVAEDDLVTRMMLSATLAGWGLEVIEVGDGDAALEVLTSSDPPRLALCDWIMPGRDGPQVCAEVRSGSPEPYIYIILLTSMNKTEDVVTGLDAGADDYVVKPYNPSELRVRLKAGERIVRLQTELIEARELLRDQANRDPMTGLLNRRAMIKKFGDLQAEALAAGQSLSALLVDIDHFKVINDTHGHDVGDLVIIEVGQRIQQSLAEQAVLSRHGGEEFLVVFPDCPLERAKELSENLREQIRSRPLVTPGGISVSLTASMGLITAQVESGDDLDAFVKQADEALYDAKEQGRDRVIGKTLSRVSA